MGHPMRLELTLAGLLVKFANHYTTRVRLLEQCMVVTILLGGFVADQMQYNLESA